MELKLDVKDLIIGAKKKKAVQNKNIPQKKELVKEVVQKKKTPAMKKPVNEVVLK